jgi:regulator of sigma E protease
MEYIVYFAITIGILVFVHEFGHFAAAKLCGMRADVFAIGFGKRLLGWNKITGFTFGELPKDHDGQGYTDYRLCLLPLGGYVKIAGMVDESMDVDFANKEPQPYEFRAKPVWMKSIVITAGVFMNLLLALIIFWGVNFFQDKQITKTTTIGYVLQNSIADSVGFKAGDKIITVNGKAVDNWEELNSELFINTLGQDLTIELTRNGQTKFLSIPRSRIPEKTTERFLVPKGLSRPIINAVMKNSPASKAGFQAGDTFLKINNDPVYTSYQATQIIQSNKENPISVTLERNNDTLNLSVTPGADGIIGVSIGHKFTGTIDYESRDFFESFYYGWMDIIKMTNLTLSMLAKVISGDVEFGKAFGGPIKIAQFAARSADTGILSFLYFLALLSLSLAIINILPFPVILLLLMAFIIYNDILNL